MEPHIRHAADIYLNTRQNKRIMIWGAGKLGAWLMSKIGNSGIGFIDNNPVKQGTIINGKPVYSPDQLEEVPFDTIWISALSDIEAIACHLSTRGFVEGKNFEIIFKIAKFHQVLNCIEEYTSFVDDVDICSKTMLEVGFGGHLFLSLLFVYLGAKKIVVTDLVKHRTGIKKNYQSIYEKFLEQLKERLPGRAGYRQDYLTLANRIHIDQRSISASELPYDSESFDIVYNSGVMEHVDHPEKAISEFRRILLPGGIALCMAIGIHDHRSNDPLSEFTPWSFLKIPQKEWNKYEKTPYHQNRWRAVDFKKQFLESGYTILKYKSSLNKTMTQAELKEITKEFRSYSLDELCEMNLFIAAEKPRKQSDI